MFFKENLKITKSPNFSFFGLKKNLLTSSQKSELNFFPICVTNNTNDIQI